ncbi:MAG: flagellar hook-basal body complex protein FliE [Syntrophomonas sp.]|uniref:flagellar hook-basal body complex protein FliE n=1 Tax=Syntrophomonas sp. TaxID=2053627 RepID=UPI0026091BAB|nr:flagellar hook-basal body complex protein FliE [Syntrophomonas sp.]MDD2509673.1 flagellar hook-basal body complex protein FliE [Syntrophomonas sp.]MDD3878508.1 flagellar hook-basal body complex protein FliE [Syntrophomonas sp.]MDD4625666.1 flagellar hook-basal body complex protein FliE [Syntrophomonas sp.]
MNLGALDSITLAGVNPSQPPAAKNSPSSKESGFFNYLKDALQEVDELQKEAASSAEKLALGDETYLHNTILAYEKANLALQLTVEIRNKVMEAYQELMRMQM